MTPKTKGILTGLAILALALAIFLQEDSIQSLEYQVGRTTSQKRVTAVSFTDRVQTSIKGVVHLQAPSWQGSGFVVGPRMIVTARHCAESVEDFLITTHEGHQLRATRAISDKKHDVAFLWVDNLECVAEERGTTQHEADLHPLSLGSIKDCVLGQNVYVIGSPHGKINFNSLSTGVISGVDRDWSPLGDHYGWKVAFTTDSTAHPGNSGGPLFTMDGKVRGVIVGKRNANLISVMPCDLFLDDLDSIRLMFALDRYRREVEPGGSDDPFYNEIEDTEYY